MSARSHTLSFVLLCAPLLAAAQHIALTTENQVVHKGKPNALRYERPEGLSAVHLVVPFGSARAHFQSRTTSVNGKVEHWADSVFIWEICDTPEPRIWAVAQGFDQGRLVLQDTTWFTVVSDSISPRLLASGGGTAPVDTRAATDLIGVGSPKTFFGNEPQYDVVGYEVTITQGETTMEHFAVEGSFLSTEQRALIAKYTFGQVSVHDIQYRHPCGVVLPARHSMQIRYLAPK